MEDKSAMKMVLDSTFKTNITNIIDEDKNHITCRSIDDEFEDFGKLMEQVISDKINNYDKIINIKFDENNEYISNIIDKKIFDYEHSKYKYILLYETLFNESGKHNGLEIVCKDDVQTYIMSTYITLIYNLLRPKYNTETINDLNNLYRDKFLNYFTIPKVLVIMLSNSIHCTVSSLPSDHIQTYATDIKLEIYNMNLDLTKLLNNLSFMDRIFKRKAIKAAKDILFVLSMVNTIV